MDWKAQYKSFLWITGFFLFAYFMPVEGEVFRNAVIDAFSLAKWYAREHVLLCLVPAFFIAGVIAVFISQNAVIKYFGAKAKRWAAYSVAAVSGTVLAVCSCTILPLFSSIHKRGAGLGPAIAFLYSGPAINILAIILTARILGFELGVARVIGAVTFSIVIGSIMAYIYRDEEKEKSAAQLLLPEIEEERPFWQIALHFFILVAILVFVNWGKPAGDTGGFWYYMFAAKWFITAAFGLAFAASMIYIIKINKWHVIAGTLLVTLAGYFFYDTPEVPFITAVIATTIALSLSKDEPNQWLGETWGFARQIMPLLGAGVLVAGFFLGSAEGNGGIIPKEWIQSLLGGNSVWANFFASFAGAFMYFATLTEIPIIQGLLNSGMGKGPALALLLAGPALSLPNMLVIQSVIGTQKTVVYVSLVVVMATISGMMFGAFF